MASRKRKDKKKQRPIVHPRRPLDRLEEHARQFAQTKQGPMAEVVINPPGAEKMSDVLSDFLDPYWDANASLKELDSLVLLGRLAWNTALLPPAEREDVLRKVEADCQPELRDCIMGMANDLIRRKLTLFADNTRYILDHKLTSIPGDAPYLSVVSSFDPPPPGTGRRPW